MRIGINALHVNNIRIQELIGQLINIDVAPEIVEIPINYNEAFYKNAEQENLDLLICPLHFLPVERKSDTKIWALLNRKEYNNLLLIHKDFENATLPLFLPNKAIVFHSEGTIIDGLQELREDLNFSTASSNSILELLNKDEIKFAIVEEMFLTENIKDRFRVIVLNEREFAHLPG